LSQNNCTNIISQIFDSTHISSNYSSIYGNLKSFYVQSLFNSIVILIQVI